MAAKAPMVLVTGASGYLATHIVQQLQKSGLYKVRGTVRSFKNVEKTTPLKNLWPGAKYPLELREADLCSEKPWVDAVKGCTYVIHVASPMPLEDPPHEDEVIRPAVDGVLHILKACRETGGVKRVVMTSSGSTIERSPHENSRTLTEADWTDICGPGVTPYIKSKTLAERTAWDFIEELPEEEKFELVVLNPTLILGPVLCGGFTGSQEISKRLLERQMPMLPRLNFNVIDVRDCALAHITAMTLPEAAGNRHILAHCQAWLTDMAQILSKEFKPQGYNVPLMEAPYFLLWFSSFFDKTLRMILPMIGRNPVLSNERMKNVLGITDPIPLEQSLLDMSYSMIEAGIIKRTSGYKGPPSEK